jgi:predicted DNA-binding transcriptional regulator YafY
VVWPIQIGFTDLARVLFAWCKLRQDFRTFRSDRIVAMTALDRYPTPRTEMVRRLRTHLDGLVDWQNSPDGN